MEQQKNDVRINVTYCGACYYGSKFRRFQADLEKYCDGRSAIRIEGWATPDRSGKFEVEVNGELIHSKIVGEGFVDSQTKLEKIMAAIETAKTTERPNADSEKDAMLSNPLRPPPPPPPSPMPPPPTLKKP